MIRLFAVLLLMLAAACSPTYGQQKCKDTAECGNGQECRKNCPGADGGVDATGICNLPCTTDADCGTLGLKKPYCAPDTCGRRHCAEAPF